MSNLRFTDTALSEWMRGTGQDSDIVISTRVRVARNLQHLPFPLLATDQQSGEVLERLTRVLNDKEDLQDFGDLHVIKLSEIDELDKKVLVEKHLISPNLANESRNGAVILTEDESVSIMINEEDHLRIQCLYPDFRFGRHGNVPLRWMMFLNPKSIMRLMTNEVISQAVRRMSVPVFGPLS